MCAPHPQQVMDDSFFVGNSSTPSLHENLPTNAACKAAQQAARRTIRDDRCRASQLLAAAQKRFEEREAAAVARSEQAEESWKTER